MFFGAKNSATTPSCRRRRRGSSAGLEPRATNSPSRRWLTSWRAASPLAKREGQTGNGLAEPMATDAKGKEGADQALIRDLAELLKETGLSEIEIERAGMRVRVARQIASAGLFAL